jgi:hypothetical protein
MYQLPDCAALMQELPQAAIFVFEDQKIAACDSSCRDLFYRGEIIGCIASRSNLKCTTRLVLRAIIEHYAVLTN